jgi:putative two-component system response regulator
MHTLVSKPTLLIVDDKRANLLALEALLAEEYRILFASSGREALAMLE